MVDNTVRMAVESNSVSIDIKMDEEPRRVPMSIEQVRTVLMESDYNNLKNKPSIERVELVGDLTFRQLGITYISAQDIDDILFGGI